MEMKNFTGDENLQTYAELYCSVEIIGEVHGQLIFLSVINIFFANYSILGEYSDPSCPSQGHINSSAIQTPVSQPSDN